MSEFTIAPPRLVLITDTAVAGEREIEARFDPILAGAAPRTVMVQLRDKELPVRRRMAFGARLLQRCRRFEQWFIVNDRMDVAVLLGADGVHLGESAVEAEDARRLLGDGAWISRACHDPAAVARPGVDAVLLSPIVEPRKGRSALGIDALRVARGLLTSLDERGIPALYALGGVRAESAAACLAAGADGVAVIGAGLRVEGAGRLLEALGISAT